MPGAPVVARPRTVAEAVRALADDPEAVVLAGGTDLMVDVNAGRVRPTSVVSLTRVDELTGWRWDGDTIVLGSRLTYADLERGELATLLPALAQAARTVGSPQIRAVATLGGNIATASPAGDTLPVLVALDAVVETAGPAGERRVPLVRLLTGVKRTGLRPGEIVTAVRVPVLRGRQEFLKVGTRNAMVISVVMVAVVTDLDGRAVRVGLGSVAPTAVRAWAAEQWVAAYVDWEHEALTRADVPSRFGDRCGALSRPIDDQRSTADYRRRAVAVCAARALQRVLPGKGSP